MHVMTSRQVTNQLLEKEPEYIPTQILQHLNYVDRKLKKSCSNDILVCRKMPYTNILLYGLKEWLGPDNFFLPRYLNKSMANR